MESHDRDFNWLSEHPAELQRRYAGQWLAVVDGEIVAAGMDGEAVYRRARRERPDAEIVIEVVDRELTNPVYELACLA